MCGPVSGKEYADKWTVDKCCCGCTLRTGCLILAWLNVVGSLLCVGLASFLFYADSDLQGGILMGAGVIGIGITIIFLLGIFKLNPILLWIVVYINVVSIIVQTILLIPNLFLGNITGAVQTIPSIVLGIYYTIVIRSYAFEVEATKEQERIQTNLNKIEGGEDSCPPYEKMDPPPSYDQLPTTAVKF